MNPFNYRSGPTLTSHSNHTIFFHEMKYIQMWDDATPVIRSERISHLRIALIIIILLLSNVYHTYCVCTNERNGCVRDRHGERERDRGTEL